MDPQQRLILEHGYHSLHASGFGKASLDDSVVGVFIGIQALEFPELLATVPAGGSVHTSTGSAHAIACGRMSFALGMQGPCASSYDTACSAGLVATHAAASALMLSECATGLATGVNLMLLPAVSVACAVAGMTAALGRCRTLDARADGYARAEACCAFVFICQGESDGAPCGASVLCGSAVRQDGRSASLTAPNGQAQQALGMVTRVRAGSSPSGCVELHGTGTALGDPIEAGAYAAVASVLGGGAELLGSIKHTEELFRII